MLRRLVVIAAGLVLVIAVGVALLYLMDDDDDERAKPKPPPALAPAPPPDPRELVVRVLPGERVALRGRPEGRILGRVGDTTEFGSRQVLSPVRLRGRWLAVRHTSLGNDGVAWLDVATAPLEYGSRPLRIDVDLSERMLSLFQRDRLARRMPVAVGAPETPTPPGEYYVTDKLRGVEFGPDYGCCILALSGRQPNLPEGWSGGDRLAIHGSPTPTWGQNVSNGCFHASEADLRFLMKAVPLGTRVVVHA